MFKFLTCAILGDKMKAKTKKLTYLTAGLTGALAASAVVGSALSSCTVTASNSTSGSITLPDS